MMNIPILTDGLHPDDLLFFYEVARAMRKVARQYELPLQSISAYPMPSKNMADRLGDCTASGKIRLVLRATEGGRFCDEPRTPERVWETAAHELAHLRHMQHGPTHHEFTLELVSALANLQGDHKAKVIDKLVKMQRQRDGEAQIGNTAAAEAFAGAINRMLIEHELNPSDIDYARATDKDPVIEMWTDLSKYRIEEKKSRIAWQEQLARVVAKAHLCSFLIRPGSNSICFVSTQSHATVAEYVFGTLVPAAATMAGKEYRRFKGSLARGHQEAAHGYYAAWLDAFIKRVTERFDEARAAMVTEAAADIPGAESLALIRLDGALVKVRKYVDDKFSSKKRHSVYALTSSGRRNETGAAHGRAAADKIAIGRRGVTGGKSQKLLS